MKNGVKNRAGGFTPAPRFDLGPTRREGGQFVPVRADVVVEDVADPDAVNRTIRRARVVTVYQRLGRDGVLEAEMVMAADRYLSSWQLATYGARDGSTEATGRTPAWQVDRMTVAVLHAAEDVRDAQAALRTWERPVVDRVVLQDANLLEAAQALGVRPDASDPIRRAAVAERLRGGLSALAERWGLTSRNAGV